MLTNLVFAPAPRRFKSRRMERELRTVRSMIDIYCHNLHGSGEDLCRDCAGLAGYAELRLEKCPFQEEKSTCAKCPIHCYKPEIRDRIREVMRYAGPRMVFRHPVLAVLHKLDGLREPPELPRRRRRRSGKVGPVAAAPKSSGRHELVQEEPDELRPEGRICSPGDQDPTRNRPRYRPARPRFGTGRGRLLR